MKIDLLNSKTDDFLFQVFLIYSKKQWQIENTLKKTQHKYKNKSKNNISNKAFAKDLKKNSNEPYITVGNYNCGFNPDESIRIFRSLMKMFMNIDLLIKESTIILNDKKFKKQNQ